MSRTRIIAALAALLLGAALAYLTSTQEKEPIYQGKKLSQWLNEYNDALVQRNEPGLKTAEAGIRVIGTNGLEYVLSKVTERQYQSMVITFGPFGWWNSWSNKRSNHQFAEQRHASFYFRVFGKESEAAIPELLRAATNPKNGPNVNEAAILSLLFIGDAAQPAIYSLLSDSNAPVCRKTTQCLDWAYRWYAPLTNNPALINRLAELSTNMMFRGNRNAMNALWTLKDQ